MPTSPSISVRVGFMLALAFWTTGSAQTAPSLPPPAAFAQPSPQPVAPAGWDIFLPAFTDSPPTSGSPVFAEWTHTAGPDESLVATGDQFSSVSGAGYGEDSDFIVFGQTTSNDRFAGQGSIQHLSGDKLALTLPASLPSWSMYFVWPKNANGLGRPIAINQTEAWWLLFDGNVHAGDSVSIHGRNLSHNNGMSSSWVYLVNPASGSQPATGQWVTATSVNPYRVQFTVPSTLPAGTYEVWVHNGHGGPYGWSGPLALRVADDDGWGGGTFNVRDYGAKGDGITDDTDAITAARDAALAHPGNRIVSLPAGTFMIRHGIWLAPGVSFRGAGRDQTTIRANNHFFDQPNLGIFGDQGGSAPSPVKANAELRDMTLDMSAADGSQAATLGDVWVLRLVWDTVRTDYHFVGVRFTANPRSTLTFGAGNVNRITFQDCEFRGGTVSLVSCAQLQFDGCTFLEAPHQLSAIDLAGAPRQISITSCTAQDLDPASPADGRFLTQRSWQYAGWYYIANNQTINMGYGPGGNSGEQILNEGDSYSYYVGHPTGATTSSDGTTSLTFADLASNVLEDTAAITAGKGFGQVRRIVAYDATSKTIVVRPALNVLPDASSQINIGGAATRFVIYQNTLSGKPDQNNFYTGSSGVQPGGLCYEWIADGNTLEHFRTGILDSDVQQNRTNLPPYTLGPSWFHLFANNTIRYCIHGVEVVSALPNLNPGERAVGVLGNVYRRNQVSDLSEGPDYPAFYRNTPTGALIATDSVVGSPPSSEIDTVLFEHNSFSNLPQGFEIRPDGTGAQIQNLVFYKNTFNLGSANYAGSYQTKIASGSTVALRENSWSGFASGFLGAPPGPVLEVPQRILDLVTSVSSSSVTATLTLWNSGTSAASWSANSDQPWLTFSNPAGTIADQGASSLLMLSCDASHLSPGLHTATITVSVGSQPQSVLVSFYVNSQSVADQEAPLPPWALCALALSLCLAAVFSLQPRKD